jgi:uncharacterized protein (TIGR02231 family)
MNFIETHIESVTVYPDRALVTRRGDATLTSGASEVLVAGLPLELEVESLRASGRGEVGVRIIGVEAREQPVTQASNETARQARRELEAAQDAGKALASQEAILNNRAQTLQKLSGDAARWFAESLAKGESSLDNFSAMLDYVGAQMRELDAGRATLVIQKRENETLQNALGARLEQWEDEDLSTEHVVAVLVESSGEGQWQLELSYVVSGASWTPLYDARVSTLAEQERFELGLNALVTQRSGEDWQDVALTLSTARPGLGTLPPKLEPVWLNDRRYEPVMASEFARPRTAMMRAAPAGESEEGGFDEMQRAPSPPAMIEAQHVEATIESVSEGATVEFKLPHHLSVPGDGQTHRVSIATREFPSKFDFFSIPRRVELAYGRATATNNSGLSLLEGAVSVFRDGVFVGRAVLKNTAPGGEFSLFLGPDEGVRAKRELVSRETDKNFLGSQKRVHFAYSIEVQNLKPRVVNLAVQDQIPVSRSENIKVKLRSSSPEATAGDLGLLNWELVLQPNEKRTLRFDYGVEAPRETTIMGLQD